MHCPPGIPLMTARDGSTDGVGGQGAYKVLYYDDGEREGDGGEGWGRGRPSRAGVQVRGAEMG